MKPTNKYSQTGSVPASGSVGVFSDTHLGLGHADSGLLYEAIDLNEFELIIKNGDWVDGWAGGNLTELQICVLDLINHKQDLSGMMMLDNEGNHNDNEMRPEVARAARDVGLLVTPGILIETPDGKSTITLHGHQFDSEKIKRSVLESADEEYTRTAEKDPANASNTKLLTKHFLATMGYDQSYQYAAHLYGAERVLIGHRHTPEQRIILPYGPLETALRSMRGDFAIASGGTIPHISTGLLRNYGHQLKNASLRKAVDMLLPRAEGIVQFLASDQHNIKARQVAAWLEKRGVHWAATLMEYAESKPDLKFLTGLSVEDLRPSYFYHRTDEQRVNPRPFELVDEGSWIDGNATFGLFDHSGNFHLVDWAQERVKRGLGSKPTDAELVKRHYETYGHDLHPRTKAQLDYYKSYVAGGLSREAREEHYVLPEKQELWRVIVMPSGAVSVAPPPALTLPSTLESAGKLRDAESVPELAAA